MRFLQDLLADLTGEKDRDHPPAPGVEDMRRAFRHISALEGDLVRLRPPRMSDAGDLYAYARDEENSRYVLWEPHQSVADSREVLRGIIRRNRRGLPATLAICLRGRAQRCFWSLWSRRNPCFPAIR